MSDPIDEVSEAIARRVHAAYLDDIHRIGEWRADEPSHRPWDDGLPEDRKHQNFHQVRHSVAVLAEFGYEVVPAARADGRGITKLPGDVIEQLAIAEHDRWAALKKLQGYTWGATRDDVLMHHPDLVHWDDLDEEIRDKDRAPMRRLPEQFAASGFAIVPR